MFKGLNTALITPFKNGEIDRKSLEKLIEYQIEGGVNGIIPCGTTGESPTLTNEEHIQVIKFCIEIVNKRVKVIAGTGSNSTKEAVEMTQYAKKLGADGSLSVAPYYNKPTPEGIYQHFKAINDNCDLPIIIYNIPGRSMIDISDEQIARLSKLENIVGIKDATGNLARVVNLRQLVNDDFNILSGDDVAALGFNAMGGNGLISVTANLAPKLASELQNEILQGNLQNAVKIQTKLSGLNTAMFSETNPIPVKYGAFLMGLCDSEIRLPLTQPSSIVKEKIAIELTKLNLI